MHHHFCLIVFSLMMDKTPWLVKRSAVTSAPLRPASVRRYKVHPEAQWYLETDGGGRPPPCGAPSCRCRWRCWPCWGPAAAWNFRSNRCLSIIALNLISSLGITFTVSFQLFWIFVIDIDLDIDLLMKNWRSDWKVGFCGIYFFIFFIFFLFC